MGTEVDEQFGHEQSPVRQLEEMPQMQSHHSNLPRLDFGEDQGSKNGNNIPNLVDEGNIPNNGHKVTNGKQNISGTKDSVSKFSANERGKSVVFGDHVSGQHSLFLPGPLMPRGGQGGRGPSLETKRRRQIYKEEMEELEMDMEIGGPTDVKHVTHIGWDGSTTHNDAVKGWENLISPDLLNNDIDVVPWTSSFQFPSMASTHPHNNNNNNNQPPLVIKGSAS
ncbi:hypothetical protein F8388_026526 [Cannabis sativa]|uniref:CRIB domain-containing protein n=1 Tax=Cannabis sativa TaxID=3483 RepID=A0A7J6E9B8_CANSA|nr:hypothetical protein F8388_026526 [Cannabis sativa]KAF4361973.1 hypothetical protein G4B88_029485 [Cannabis sativa]